MHSNNNPKRWPGRWLQALMTVLLGALLLAGTGARAATETITQQLMTGHVQWGGVGGVVDAASDGLILGPLFGAAAARGSGVEGVKGGLSDARAARDALAAELAPLKGKAPATVTGGYNIKTGDVAARACNGGLCAENHVVDALGGVKNDVRFTEAIRPRTGAEVPVCLRGETTFGREVFPRNTRFKSDE